MIANGSVDIANDDVSFLTRIQSHHYYQTQSISNAYQTLFGSVFSPNGNFIFSYKP